jgi:hypothetical protein
MTRSDGPRRLAQPPPDAVAPDRLADFFRDGEAEADRGVVVVARALYRQE